MEELSLYTFFDKKAQRFDTPFVAKSDLFALRHFQMAINKEGSLLNTFKMDFSLKKLGTFNVITGLIKPQLTDIMDGGKISNAIDNEA